LNQKGSEVDLTVTSCTLNASTYVLMYYIHVIENRIQEGIRLCGGSIIQRVSIFSEYIFYKWSVLLLLIGGSF
jgi:hypothetical protein